MWQMQRIICLPRTTTMTFVNQPARITPAGNETPICEAPRILHQAHRSISSEHRNEKPVDGGSLDLKFHHDTASIKTLGLTRTNGTKDKTKANEN